MEIMVFGKKFCSGCEDTKRTLEKMINEKSLKINYQYYDMDTIDGLAEGAYNQVGTVPTTIVIDKEKIVARWNGVVPPLEELKKCL